MTARRTARPLALLVAGTLFMELLDSTIISTAAPRMAHSFGVGSADISVAITAYLLAAAILIPLSGWLSDRFGVRKVFGTAIAVFTVASVLCALSTNLVELTVMRAVQGGGGALMVPVGQLVVLRNTAKADVISAIAFLTWPALLAPILAPLIGGALSTYASWQWIFLVNVPLGMLALILAWRLVPRLSRPPRLGLDGRGLVLSALGLTSLVYGCSLLAAPSVRVVITVLAFGLAVVFLSLTTLHLLRTPEPLLDLRALRIATFRASQLGGSLFRMSVFAVPFLLPLMFQDDFGWSPLRAWSEVSFVFLGNLAIKPFTTAMLRRFGFRTVLLMSNAMAGLATAACGLLNSATPLVVLAALLIAGGMFRSIGFSAYNTITYADISPTGVGHANTLASTIQQLASGLGVAAGAMALRFGQALGSRSAAGSPHLAYTIAFLGVGLLVVPGLAEAWRLPRTAGQLLGGGIRA